MTAPFSISECLDFLETNVHYLGESEFERLARLLPALPNRSAAQGSSGNSGNSLFASAELPDGNSEMDIDMLEEVKQQMIFIRALRKSVSNKLATLSTKELKDLVTTTNSVFSMLTRLQTEIINQNRVLKLQNATITAISELPVEVQARFFEELEDVLGKITAGNPLIP